MPWEKSFEESEVIDTVTQLFWEKGFEATSISDITTATGIQRGSLYNAFDGKRDLFVKCLSKYDAEQLRQPLAMLEQVDSPCEAISMLFESCAEHSVKDPKKKGCMIVNTWLDYSIHDTEVQKMAASSFKELIRFFENAINRGILNGEIPDSVEPKSTARALIALLAGLRVLGRGVVGKKALGQIVEQAKKLIS